MTATDAGESSAERSGILVATSAQAEAARDDAAQDLGGAALDRELGRDERRELQALVEARALRALGAGESGELPHPRGEPLLPQRPQVLDDRAFHYRLGARGEHAAHRDRHA